MRLNQEAGTSTIAGMGNPEAAAACEIVVLTVPFANQVPTLDAIAPALDGRDKFSVVFENVDDEDDRGPSRTPGASVIEAGQMVQGVCPQVSLLAVLVPSDGDSNTGESHLGHDQPQ